MCVQGVAKGSPPRVSVVIPALNEARNIPFVLSRIPPDVHEVILVDGYSVDGTVSIARRVRPDVRVVRQSRTGKGNALACGFALATGDVIAMVDADGSTDQAEIPRFVTTLLEGADFAKGTRFAPGGRSDDITRMRSLGNRLLTTLINLCYGVSYSDLCYGFNVFWRRHAVVLGLDANAPPSPGRDGRLWGDGFEIETLIHIRVARAGLAVVEVPSHEHARIHGVSNLNAFSDGIRVLTTILAERRRTGHGAVSSDLRDQNAVISPSAGEIPVTSVLTGTELCLVCGQRLPRRHPCPGQGTIHALRVVPWPASELTQVNERDGAT